MEDVGGSNRGFANAVTLKVIGIALTLAISISGWSLSGKLSDILENQARIGEELTSISKVVYDHQLYSAAASQEFRSGIADNRRRIEMIEREHESEKRRWPTVDK